MSRAPAARAKSQQQAVLGRLAGAAPTNVKHFDPGQRVLRRPSPTGQAAALAADPAVASVVPRPEGR